MNFNKHWIFGFETRSAIYAIVLLLLAGVPLSSAGENKRDDIASMRDIFEKQLASLKLHGGSDADIRELEAVIDLTREFSDRSNLDLVFSSLDSIENYASRPDASELVLGR